jgi:pSer/pThr/pTyr-binding forkhead associated (FHA) protein
MDKEVRWMAKLILKFKEAALKEIPLKNPIYTIGRKPNNDIPIDNLAVSGTHAKVYKKGEQYYVEDAASLNGTFVNGKKVSVFALNEGDEILIGKHTLTFVSELQSAEAPKERPKEKDLMDETILIDAKLQEQFLGKPKGKTSEAAASGGGAPAHHVPEKGDVLGGFVIIEGATDQKEYDVKDRIATIGKDDNALIQLKGFFAPKVAALVNRKKDCYTITSSTGGKGLKINGREIEGQYKLKEGDMVEVAGLKMQFYIKE